MIVDYFGSRLKSARIRAGLTQPQLAEKIGLINYQSISQYERQNKPPKFETVQKMADVLNTTTQYLLGENDDMNRSYDAERAQTPYGRFEIMCDRYIHGTEAEKAVILNSLTQEEQLVFLMGAGLYHLFTDSRFYDETVNALAIVLYEELNMEQPKLAGKMFLCRRCSAGMQAFSKRDECEYKLVEFTGLPSAAERNPQGRCNKCRRTSTGSWFSWVKKEIADD